MRLKQDEIIDQGGAGMIRGRLVVALDFEKDGKTQPVTYSYRCGGKWFWVSAGDGYSNTREVTEYDAAGEAVLLAREDKEESS